MSLDSLLPSITYRQFARLIAMYPDVMGRFGIAYGQSEQYLAMLAVEEERPSPDHHEMFMEYWQEKLDRAQQSCESERWALQQRMEEMTRERG